MSQNERLAVIGKSRRRVDGRAKVTGQTIFADAMAGRGTRVTFSGELDLRPGMLGSLSGIESIVSGFIESIVTTIIPRNLRAVVEAAAAYELPAK